MNAKNRGLIGILVLVLIVAFSASPAFAAKGGVGQGVATHIIVFNDGVDAGAATAALARAHGLGVTNVYRHALSGAAAVVPPGRLHALERDPRVAFVEANQVVSIFDHVTPNGILRANADVSNTNYSVDADIAIIDTGIELDNPDLNVFKYANCARKGPLNTSCNENDDGADDGNGHGTHVAGTAAAKNNNIGAVGMAPGARLWAVKVLGNDGSGWMNWIIGGIDYVTANADQIDVANMSLGCKCDSNALDAALTNSVAAGVTFAVAAGNSMEDASTFSPANHPDVITVSAMADFDGVGGGLTDTTVTFGICTEYEDDSFACFSNYGEDVNIAAPGVNILSTALGGGTATLIPS